VWSVDLWREDEDLLTQLYKYQFEPKNNFISSWEGVEKIAGKILVADFETVTDGASEDCSEGIIDIFDLPPIDTWFYLSRNERGSQRIYAWIPAQFEPLVDDAIAVNCMGCLYWLEETQQQ
jgi:hypothetical protein